MQTFFQKGSKVAKKREKQRFYSGFGSWSAELFYKMLVICREKP
jgi:hypothetical protein